MTFKDVLQYKPLILTQKERLLQKLKLCGCSRTFLCCGWYSMLLFCTFRLPVLLCVCWVTCACFSGGTLPPAASRSDWTHLCLLTNQAAYLSLQKTLLGARVYREPPWYQLGSLSTLVTLRLFSCAFCDSFL